MLQEVPCRGNILHLAKDGHEYWLEMDVQPGAKPLIFSEDRLDIATKQRLLHTVRAGNVFGEQSEIRVARHGKMLERLDYCPVTPTG